MNSRHSTLNARPTDELTAVADRNGLDGVSIARTSRLVAKVDNTAVQDGFQLYLHAFILADDGAPLSLALERGVVVRRGAARCDRR